MTPEELRARNDRILQAQIMALCRLEEAGPDFVPTVVLEVAVPSLADLPGTGNDA